MRSAVATSLFVCCFGLLSRLAVAARLRHFLVISSPERKRIYAAELPTFYDLTVPPAERPVTQAVLLIDGTERCLGWACRLGPNKGLKRPASLALHQKGKTATLYVSDTEAATIYAYSLQLSWNGQLEVGGQRAVQTVPGGASGLAVDGMGNLIYSTAQDGRIHVIDPNNGTITPQDLFAPDKTPPLASPAGLAADGLYVYWANSKGDPSTGAVARGPRRLAAADIDPPQALTLEAPPYQAAAESVCVARDNVFFTGKARSLLAVKGSGSNIVEVARNLEKPRGCVYDGDGTLYVADAATNAILSMPSNLGHLRTVRHVNKVVSVEQPDQLAIFSGSSGMMRLPDVPGSAAACGAWAAGRIAFLLAAWAAAPARSA